VNGEPCLDPAARVSPDAEIVVDERAPRRRTGPLPESALVFRDRDIVVVEKPAGVLSVADEPGNKATLAEHTRVLLRRIEGKAGVDTGLGVVHRLDKDTSGLLVLTRTAEAKRRLAASFRAHDVDRIYLALAHGAVPARDVDTHLVEDRGDGLRGSHGHYRRDRGNPPSGAKRAVTHVRPVERLAAATLIECRLETGRQHQIRIHLSELGHPLVGERVYIRDYGGPRVEAPRVMLHAHTLGFDHPRTGERLAFRSEPPADFQALLESLR
jgi:23S rRNA pseudouridine1911/1915/1917 synthase